MKIKLILCALLIVFTAAGGANADLTEIYSSQDLDLLGTGGILDQLYGLGNLQRVDDAFDQVWFPADGNVTAQAKYAIYTHSFGYIPQNGVYQELFSTPGGLGFFTTPAPTGVLSSGNVNFKWALDTGIPSFGVWTSMPIDNSDNEDHMVTWRITGGDAFANDEGARYVIAWEDRPYGSESDFNDLVVEVVHPSPVPIPTGFLLLGSGLIGLVGIRKRIKR